MNGQKRQLKLRATVVIVPIHGTFARDAEWCQPDSGFCQSLLKSFDALGVVVPFTWSGKNSHRARLQAAEELQRFLRSSLQSYPKTPHFLIAHSHGGNVALYAMNDSSLPEAIPGIVFMGTPFVLVEPRRLPPNSENLFRLAGFAVGLFVFSLAVRVFLRLVDLPLPGLVLGILMLPLLLLVPFLSGYAVAKWLSSTLPSWVTQKQQQIQKRLQLPRADEIPKLNVTVDLDEATAYLRLLTALSNIPAHLFRILSATASFEGALVGILSLLLAGALQNTPGVYLALIPVALLVTWLCLPALQILMQFVPKFMRSHSLGFGGETLLDNWLARIHVVTEPPDARARTDSHKVSRTALRRLKPRSIVLNHSSIYQSTEATARIGDWIAARIRDT